LKVIEAINAAADELENILVAAGLKNGLELSTTELADENGLIFWPGQVKSKAGSDKEQYLTYTPTAVDRTAYGDGIILSRTVTIRLELFSRNRSLNTDAETIENALTQQRWGFEFLDFEYDTGNQMYIYTFETKAEVADE
jgi:hypothetical protein